MSTTEAPIITLLTSLLVEQGGRLHLEPAGLERLSDELRTHFGKPTLADTVRGLLRFAAFLDCHRSSPRAADAIIEVLKQAKGPMLASGLRLDDALQVSAEAEKQRDLLGGKSEVKASPKPDAPSMKWWETRKKDED